MVPLHPMPQDGGRGMERNRLADFVRSVCRVILGFELVESATPDFVQSTDRANIFRKIDGDSGDFARQAEVVTWTPTPIGEAISADTSRLRSGHIWRGAGIAPPRRGKEATRFYRLGALARSPLSTRR